MTGLFSPLELTGRARTHIQQFDSPRFAATSQTATAFLAMRDVARADGIELVAYSSFCDFNAQVRIWNNKFAGKQPLYDLNEKPLDYDALSEVQRVLAILNWTGLPGASRRHWGTDIDVIDRNALPEGSPQLLPSEVGPGGVFECLHVWLDEHIERFGFFRPYQFAAGGMFPELWHLSFAHQSSQAIKGMNFELVRDALIDSSILGKGLILTMLPEILDRHVFNFSRPGVPHNSEILNISLAEQQSGTLTTWILTI